MVYLDAASTTYPLFTRNTIAYPEKNTWMNANTPYAHEAKALFQKCENMIKTSMGVHDGRVLFVGNATQSYKVLQESVYHSNDIYDDDWDCFFKTPFEHSSITGAYIKTIDELMDADILRDEASSGYGFVVCQLVNNITGDILPYDKIAKAVHEVGGYLICDATSAVGKIKIDENISEMCDAIFCSAHKFHGEKGQGFLYINKRLYVDKIKELELNGTPDPQGAYAIACAFVEYNQTSETDWDDYIENKFYDLGIEFRNVFISGLKNYTGSIVCYCLPDIGSADALQSYLADRDIYIGVGHSSCEDDENRYRVLNAVGLSNEEAEKCIRLSYDGDKRKTIKEDIDALCQGIKDFIVEYCEVKDYGNH